MRWIIAEGLASGVLNSRSSLAKDLNMLSPEVRDYIDRSVLCWLATVDPDGRPNVSPKEVFAALDDAHVVIANIASPQSVRNIRSNPQVCPSFVDVFVQKGYKLRGDAKIIDKNDPRFATFAESLLSLTKGIFPIHSVIHLHVVESEPIVAPSYRLVPGTTEESQIRSAMATYGVAPRSVRD